MAYNATHITGTCYPAKIGIVRSFSRASTNNTAHIHVASHISQINTLVDEGIIARIIRIAH